MIFHQYNGRDPEESTAVKNKLLKAVNPSRIRENSSLDSPFTAEEVSKGIAQLKNKKQMVMIR